MAFDCNWRLATTTEMKIVHEDDSSRVGCGATGVGKPVRGVVATGFALLCLCLPSSFARASVDYGSPWEQSAAPSEGQPQDTSRLLELGKPIERELRGGEIHTYRIDAEPGQFIRIIIEKKGMEAAGALIGPDGKLIAIAERTNGPFGAEPVSAIVAASGGCVFRIFPANKNAPPGRYEVTLTDLRLPRAEDSIRIAAERAFFNGLQLQSQGTAETRGKAIAKFEESLKYWRDLGDRAEQAATLTMIGRLHSALGEKQKALDCYNEALPLERAVGDRFEEATTLNNIGLVYDDLGELHRALDSYGQALQLRRAQVDRRGEAATLGNIGLVYAHLGEQQKALDYYNEALPLQRALGDKSGEATTLSNIGSVYDASGEKQKALDYFEQALALKRTTSDRTGLAVILSNIGRNYDAIGEQQKALEYYGQALALERSLGDRNGEATTLLNIGGVYSALGEMKKALDNFERALTLQRAVGDRSGEAATLNNLGVVNAELGELDKALDYYGQALPLKHAVGNPSAEAVTLNNLGVVYARLGKNPKALEYYEQALQLRHAADDRPGEAITLSNIGAAYDALGEKQKAIGFLAQALALNRAVGNRSGEATTLNNTGAAYDGLGEREKAIEQYERALTLESSLKDPILEGKTLGLMMQHWQEEKKPSLAIFFGKQAVNSYQQIRGNMEGLEKATQKSFADSVEGTYRRLADLLVAEGRLFEAQQVLDLLKEEEFKQFTRGDNSGGAAGTLALRSDEAAMDQRYREASGSTAALWNEWNGLNAKSPRTPDEEQRLQALSKGLSDSEQAFQKFLSQDLYEQLGKNKQADASVRGLEQETSDLQAILHELEPGTVAIYTVIAPERLIIILVLPDARISREYPIKPEALREKVFGLRRMLLSPESDPLPAAQELYKIVLGPIEKDLQAAGAKTLMWSLDDVLRYVPIAALHDGKHYVVENYRNEIFTLSSISKLKDASYSGSWQALAMGVSKSYGDFSALPTVPAELRDIVHAAGEPPGGLMPGVMLLDDTFTKEALEAGLRNGFPIVHVASHFSFQTSGDDFSFLLLGGKNEAGEHLTLSDIKTDVNIRFWNTELLTLSACESALSGERNGRELDGLGEIAQRKGAKAVIASLWSVSDQSTSALMRKFYEIWTTHAGMPKVEALKQAQIALLREEVKPEAGHVAPGESAPPKSFAHPYYWAPFILIGNWR